VVEFGTTPGATDAARIDLPASETSFSWELAQVPQGTYYVRVSGVNGQGPGPPSNEIALTFEQGLRRVPGRPTGLAASVTEGRLTLTWNPALDGGSATGYVVEVSTVLGAVNLYKIAIPASPAMWSFPVVPSTAYYLRVSGLNAFGVGTAPAEIATGSDAPAGALPTAPRGLNASVANRRLTLLWTAPGEGARWPSTSLTSDPHPA
jgi:hypothetical protein